MKLAWYQTFNVLIFFGAVLLILRGFPIIGAVFSVAAIATLMLIDRKMTNGGSNEGLN